MLKSKFLLWGQRLIERGAWFLAPLSWLWGLVSFCRNTLYDRGWLSISRVERPVVSVGNLVAGGTGKTPLVHLIASRFAHRRVAILSRGYGPIPDEPLLLRRRLSAVKVYIGKNRVELAKQAIEEGAQLLILDDGFQHRALHRDFDLVILSGADPFGKGHFLPRGFLRDSPRRLKDADAIFISGKGTLAPPPTALEAKAPPPTALEVKDPPPTALEVNDPPPTALEVKDPPPTALEAKDPLPTALEAKDPLPTALEAKVDSPIALEVKVDRVLDLSGNPSPSISGWRVALFSGIAKPASFKKTVVDLGAEPIAEWILADHEPADPARLESFASRCKALGARAILCTEKDIVKLDPSTKCALPLYFLEISFQVSAGEERWENLIAKIDQKIDNITAYE